MSITYVRSSGPGILGTLGTLASLGGTMFGVPMLTTLGTGMTGLDTLMNGGGDDETIKKTGGAMSEILKTLWKKPTDENIASTAGVIADAANGIQKQLSYEDLAKKWGYNYGGGWF